MSSIAGLHRRINKTLAAIENHRIRAAWQMPIRILAADGSLISETPQELARPGCAYQVYIGFNPDEDGIEP